MSLQAQVRAVTFDVGGTLIEPWPSVGHVYAEVAARHGIRADPDALTAAFGRGWKQRRGFDYSRAHWFTLVEEAFGGIAPVSAGLFDAIYSHFTLAEPWRVYDDVVPTLERLTRRGLKLAVISNWDERLRPLLRAVELDRFFDAMIISTEVGAHKPDLQIYAAALKALGMTPAEVLHVGDGRREDLEGARAAGLTARLIRRGEGNPGGDEISTLAALVD